MLNKAIYLIKAQDTYAAIEHLVSENDPLGVIKNFSELVRYLFWQEKDLPAMIAMGRAGIQYGVMSPDREVREVAKTIAYNLASYTWSGWEDERFKISPADTIVGLDAAKTCVRLCKELDLEDIAKSRAQWVLGAQYLAAKNIDKAKYHFYRAAVYAHRAGDESESFLAWAFISIAKQDTHQLAEIEKRLQALENGRIFLNQIDMGKRVFLRESSLVPLA